MKKLMFIIVLLLVAIVICETADARGRIGSRRVYSGHGKGSHYVGGK